MQVSCPSCGRVLNLPEHLLGSQVRCPLCQRAFQAAAPPPSPPPTFQSHVPASAASPPPGPSDFDRPHDHGGPAPDRGRDYFDEGPDPRFPGGPSLSSINQTVAWLIAAGGIDIVLTLMVIVFSVANRGDFDPQDTVVLLMMSAVCSILLLATPAVFILIAAAMLKGLRSKGMVLTGSVMAFVASFMLLMLLFGLLGEILDAEEFGGRPGLMPGVLMLMSLVGMALNITAGVRGVLALNHPAWPRFYR
ncbi:MAG: zinc-ribbon domain-containing protein [Gemmataceae bacterium]|nr:zinc-ribbon domain-containing protein [Gemmataceae bacterium]